MATDSTVNVEPSHHDAERDRKGLRSSTKVPAPKSICHGRASPLKRLRGGLYDIDSVSRRRPTAELPLPLLEQLRASMADGRAGHGGAAPAPPPAIAPLNFVAVEPPPIDSSYPQPHQPVSNPYDSRASVVNRNHLNAVVFHLGVLRTSTTTKRAFRGM